MSTLPEITDATFAQEVLEADDVVLVKFWAEWCPPCRALDPVLQKLVEEGHPGLRIVSMNSDENPQAALTYQVLGLPTMKVFRGGEVEKTMLGAMSLGAAKSALASYLR